jgi:hypothetical protein
MFTRILYPFKPEDWSRGAMSAYYRTTAAIIAQVFLVCQKPVQSYQAGRFYDKPVK